MAAATETCESSFDKPRLSTACPAKHRRPQRHQQPDFIRKTVDPWTSFQGISNYVGHKDNLQDSRKPVRALLADQVGLPEFNVSYSLNKKGRWQLPRIMQRDIEAYQDTPKHLRVSLINAKDDAVDSQQPPLFQSIKSFHTLVDNEPVHRISKRGKAKAADFLRPENPARHSRGRLLKNPGNPSELLDDKNYFNSPLEEELESWERNAHVVYTTFSETAKPKTQKLGKGSKKDTHYDFDVEVDFEEEFDEECEESEFQEAQKSNFAEIDQFLVFKNAKKRVKKTSQNFADLSDDKKTSPGSSTSSDDFDYIYVDQIPQRPVGKELPLVFLSEDPLDLIGLFGVENIDFCDSLKPETCCVKLTELSAETLKFVTGTYLPITESDVAVVVKSENTTRIYLNKAATTEAEPSTSSSMLSRENVLPSIIAHEKLVYPQTSYDEAEGRDMVREMIFSQQKPKPAPRLLEECLKCGSTSETSFSLSCAHLFCRDCARTHVLIEDSLPLTCPYPGCPALYDPTTLTSFMKLSFVREYEEKIVEKRLQLADFLKCYRCKRISHFPNDGINAEGIAVCPCGEAICRKCEKEAHAPLTCKNMKFYEEILARKGHTFHIPADLSEFIPKMGTVICPACTYPVEKVYRSNHITCWCGNSFCYRCGEEYPTSDHQCGEKIAKKTFELTDQEVSDFSKRVLEHCEDIRQKKIVQLSNSFFKRFRGAYGINKATLVPLQRRYTQLFDVLERAVVDEYLGASNAQRKFVSSRLEFTLTRIFQILYDGSHDNVPNIDQLKGLLLESVKLARNLLSLYEL